MSITIPQVLDPCCSGKMFWFDKNDSRAMFCDCRSEEHTLCDKRSFVVNPDTISDFRNLPFRNEQFWLVVFDPPHLVTVGEKSWLRTKYGALSKNSWQVDLSMGFNECWRVLHTNGTLIFKWNEEQVSLKEVLSCFPQKPLFGHRTKSKTHWMTFFKEE